MTVPIAGENIVLDPSGAAYVPDRRTLIAALCARVYEQAALFQDDDEGTPEASALRTTLGTYDPTTLCWIVRGSLATIPGDLVPPSLEVRFVSATKEPGPSGLETIQRLMVGTMPVVDQEDSLVHQEGLCVGGYRDPETMDPLFILRHGRLCLPFVGRGNAPLPGGFPDAEILAVP